MKTNASALLGGAMAALFVVGSMWAIQTIQHKVHPHQFQQVTGLTMAYHSLAEAREVATHYYCTDIIQGKGPYGDLYVVEILRNEECDK